MTGQALFSLTDAERRRAEEVERLFEERAVASLVERLTDPSWSVRRAVVSALGRLGDDAIEPLCELLRTRRDDETRLAATVDAMVGSLGAADEAALRLATSRDPSVACDAAQILGRRRAAVALPTLAALARHENENVALAAIEAIGRVGGDSAIDLLVEAVGSRSFFRTFPAVDALGRTGDPRAVAPLVPLLDESPYAIEAARALGRTGQPSAVTPLARLLVRAADALVRVAAVAMVEIGTLHAARFGPSEIIVQSLRALDVVQAGRRMTQALVGADAHERAALCRVLGWMGGTYAAQALVEMLDADTESASAAATALSAMGADVEPQLVAALPKSSSERRLLVLPLLGRNRSSAGDVLPCLQDADPAVRAAACDALGRLGDPGTVPALFALFEDEDGRVSQSAVAAVQALGGDDAERLALERAASSDRRVRRSSLRVLAYFGFPAAFPVFLAAMRDPDERIRDVAASGLAGIDDERARAALLEASTHSEPHTRISAVRALGQTHGEAGIRARLHAALEDEEPWVRYYACQALGYAADESAASAIAQLVRDPAGHVRVAALDALARLKGERALEALREAAQSGDPDVERAALLAVGRLHAAAALPLLERASKSADSATRLVALSALAELDAPEVVGRLRDAMGDADEAVRNAAIALLAPRRERAATTALIEGLADPTVSHRALAGLSEPVDGRVPTIVDALRAADAGHASLLAWSLARMQRPEAVAGLATALDFDNVYARRAAASALAASTAAQPGERLRRAAASDPDADVRRICAAALDR